MLTHFQCSAQLERGTQTHNSDEVASGNHMKRDLPIGSKSAIPKAAKNASSTTNFMM